MKRAFSLIEVAVVLAMVGIIGAVAASVCSLVLNTVKNTKLLAALNSRAQQPLLYLQQEIQRAGGNGIPGAAAIVVENDCGARGELPDCGGTDRINVFTALNGPVCRAESIDSTTVKFTWPQGGCCLKPSDTDGVPFRGHLMLQRGTSTATPQWRPIYAEATDGTACSFSIQDVLPPAILPTGSAQLMGASAAFDAVLVEARTFYLDPSTHELWLLLDSDAPTAPGEPTVAGNRLLIASRIYDFQVAVALDDNKDGVIASSEWAYRVLPTPPASIKATAPMLVWVTDVTGIDDHRGNTATVASPLRGTPVTRVGEHLRAGSLQVAPLNGALGPGFSFPAGP
jgi:prepilin-type N-terminal cleavage/methylation domain-containing protein